MRMLCHVSGTAHGIVVTFANTIISNVGKVEGLDPTLRDEYLGRAYFHRAYAYYHGVLLFGDIPLITKLIEVPKTKL